MQEKESLKSLLSSKDSEIADKTTKMEQMDKEIRDLNLKLAELSKKLAMETMTNKKAMEKAITQSVRLCVVAPTVNVHVNDTKHKFKSRYCDSSYITHTYELTASLYIVECLMRILGAFWKWRCLTSIAFCINKQLTTLPRPGGILRLGSNKCWLRCKYR